MFNIQKNINNNMISICIDHSDFNIHILTLDCLENKRHFYGIIEVPSYHIPTRDLVTVSNLQRPRPCSHIDMAVRA